MGIFFHRISVALMLFLCMSTYHLNLECMDGVSDDTVYEKLNISKDVDCFAFFGLPFFAPKKQVEHRYREISRKYRAGFDSGDVLSIRITQAINAARDKCLALLDEKSKFDGQPSWLARASKKVTEKAKETWDEAENFARAQPKFAATVGLSSAVIGGCLAYKAFPCIRKSIDRKADSLRSRFDNSYYDFVENYMAPLQFKWEDLHEESLTRGDLVRVGGIVGLGYALKKLNSAFDITGRCSEKIYNAKEFAMPIVRDLQHRAVAKLKLGYQFAKRNPGKTLAFFAGITAMLCVKQLYDSLTEENRNYRTLIKELWSSLSEEQVAQIDPSLFLELINHAAESPLLLQETPEFLSILTDEQYDCLQEAIADFQKETKRLKIAV